MLLAFFVFLIKIFSKIHSKLIIISSGMKTTMFAMTIMVVLLPSILAIPHEITRSNFKELFSVEYEDFHTSSNVDQTEWIVMFYAPWCGFCKKAKPIFEDFSKLLVDSQITEATEKGIDIDEHVKKGVQTGLINCVAEEDICQYFNIRGYPTIYYLTAEKKAVSYNGPRSVKGLFDLIESHDPQDESSKCQEGFVNFGIIDILKEAFGLYWQYIVGFGVILPMFVGYFLAEFLNRRDEKKMKAEKEARRKQQQEGTKKSGSVEEQKESEEQKEGEEQKQNTKEGEMVEKKQDQHAKND